jgi:threonine dehydrogenase-like Zn-dependent dehydrogenase
MKAAVLHGAHDIRIGQAPDPRIASDQVLVRSSCAGICGTDLHIFRGEFGGRVTFPAIQGHEFGGVVEEVGAEVTDVRAGDRVAVDPILPCHRCPACRSGHINACATLRLLGIELPGGFGEYVAVPRKCVHPLPDAVPLAHVPMVEVYGLAHHILYRGEVQPGETVAILGAGKLGLAVLDVLCHGSGAATTFITDVQPFRLATARRVGAEHAIDLTRRDAVAYVREATRGVGVDCVIECVGHHREVPGQGPPLAQAVEMIRHGGRVVTAGLGEAPTAVPFKALVLKEGRIIGSRTTAGEFTRAVRLMAKGMLHPELLITHRLPLGEVTRAFETLDADEPSTIKIVLDVTDA